MNWMSSGLSAWAPMPAAAAVASSANNKSKGRMVRQYNRRTMERRDFVRLAGAGLAAGAAAAEAPLDAVQAPRPSRKALMKVGTQHGDSDEILRAMAGF